MGLMKKIKNSYVFTHMEVGKYTKRRTGSTSKELAADNMDYSASTRRRADFISEFDQAAEDMRRERLAETARHNMAAPGGMTRSNTVPQAREQWGSTETLDATKTRRLQHRRPDNFRPLSRYASAMDMNTAQDARRQNSNNAASGSSQATTAVTSPSSPFSGSASPDDDQIQPIPRARPKGARAARSTVDMQSVYFAPGRNVNTSIRRSGSPTDKIAAEINSASSIDYYVFTPTHKDVANMPYEVRKKQRAVVAPDTKPAKALHRAELAEEQQPTEPTTNPFIARRKKAQQMASEGWNAASPFDDPIINSGRGGIDPEDPRKHLTTPVYANQASGHGVDLLA